MMRSAFFIFILGACSTTSKKNEELTKKDEISSIFPKDNPAGESQLTPVDTRGKSRPTR